jgi:hypothetical protein
VFSSNRPRREHYVPRVYLEHFGTSLTGFDKRTGNVFTTTSKNVAFEEGFYDLDPNIDLEGLIAKNERSLMSGIRELIEKSNPTAISSESRAKVSLFVSLQFVRTREYREEIKETGGKFLTEIVNNEPRFKGFDFKVVMKEELAQALQAQAIVDDTVPKTAWFLGNSRWTLLVNRSKVPFWTSDNPVTLFNPVDYGEAGGLGFNVRGIQTHFPLNSSLLLLILDPTSYDMPPIKIV